MSKPAGKSGVAVLLLSLTCILKTAAGAADTPVTPERPAEYMVYQYPDTALVFRVDLPQAEFSARVIGPDNALLRAAGVAGRRLGPVFVYVGDSDEPRQLMIEVRPGRTVDRSQIALELLQFELGERNAAALARAYRMLSVGVETARSDDTVTWASKVYSLRDAAQQFARLGRQELSLWADYLAAHQALHRLDDHELALEWAGEVRQTAERAGLEVLVLVARVLESECWLARLEANTAPAAFVFQRSHEALAAAAGLAGTLGLKAEQARALYRDGLVWDRQGEAETALERFRSALELLAGGEDSELLSEVRAAAAAAYERQGSTSGALAVLEGSAGEPGSADSDAAARERAGRLYDRGRLLNLAYRYPEAVDALREALSIQRQSPGLVYWGRTGLELAWSFYSLGRDEEAIELLRESLPRTVLQENESAMARAWGSLADMLGARGRHREAVRARESQREVIRAAGGAGAAGAAYASALDARRRNGPRSIEYRELLGAARRVAKEDGDRLAEARATVALCLAQADAGRAAACRAAARQALERLRNSGIPRLAVEAAISGARLLARNGRQGESAVEWWAVLDEIQWYRRTLPGVLGAWYHAQVEAVSAAFLDQAAPPGTSPTRSLVALERLRQFERDTTPGWESSPLDLQRQESLRSLLLRCEAAPDKAGLAEEVNQALADARRSCSGCAVAGDVLDEAGLAPLLDSLDSSQSVLAYALGGDRAWAVFASRGQRKRVELGAAVSIRDSLHAAHQTLSDLGPSGAQPELDTAGQWLAAPLQGLLTERVYLLQSGSLRALPLDALRLGGRFLAEQSRIVGLGSLASLGSARPGLRQGYPERVFLAGNPQSQRDPFRFELSASPEITAVTEQFIGPGLHVVQGVALGRDEFDDPRFLNAALLHLALPGVIDLARPAHSRLLLGGADVTGIEQHGLAPADVRRFGSAADLVVISGTAVSGGGSAHSAYLPLVSDFTGAGAAAVVYTLWPVGEASAAAFAQALYEHLAVDPDIEAAFFAARSAGFPDGVGGEFENWSGFQLFIR